MSLSLEKGLRLLLVLSEHAKGGGHGLALRDLAAESELDKATAYRLLRSLGKYAFIEQDEGGHYALGTGALGLAQAAFRSHRLVQRLLPVMRAVHAATQETINLAERQDLVSVTVHELPSAAHVRYTTRIGAWAPLHLGASSRATLAFSPPAVREAVLAGALTPVTPASIADRPTLESTLAAVRRDGYAISRGERVEGTNALAVPLLDSDGYAIGSLAVLWPSRGDAVDEEHRATWPAVLLDAIRDVQGTL